APAGRTVGMRMAERRSFLLRIDPAVLDAVQRWADDDLGSLNGQIEFLLRRGRKGAGRAVTAAREERGERRDRAEQRRARARDAGRAGTGARDERGEQRDRAERRRARARDAGSAEDDDG